MPARIEKVGDLWSDLLRRKRSLKRAIERLKNLHGADESVRSRSTAR
jgi:hypothetical protein